MNCLQVEENFSAHFEDALDYQALQRFDAHLEECAACQHEYAQFRESVKASQQLPQIEPSPYFMPTLQQRLSEEQRSTVPFWKRVQRIFYVPKWAFSGVMVLLLITATVTFLYHDDFFNRETRPLDDLSDGRHFQEDKQIGTPHPAISTESPSLNQFLPRGTGSSEPPAQPMQQHYTLKRVSYSTISTAGGL